MATSLDVAHYILKKTGTLTTRKLQKLVFFCQYWSCGYGNPLFTDRIEAWKLGPVVPKLFYHHQKKYKVSADEIYGDLRNLTSAQKEIIDDVLDHLSDKNADELIFLSHIEKSYVAARDGIKVGESGNQEITQEALVESIKAQYPAIAVLWENLRNKPKRYTLPDESELKPFPKINIESILSGDNKMTNLSERGYTVKENGPIYYTQSMDETVKWFQDILGWYGGIDARDDNGNGTYGCVLPVPGELVNMHITSFIGMHLFPGEPEKRIGGLIMVDSIDGFYQFVKGNGWDEITEISHQPWGARVCSVTTIDGTQLNFFELE